MDTSQIPPDKEFSVPLEYLENVEQGEGPSEHQNNVQILFDLEFPPKEFKLRPKKL